jgi:hypothetical protein
MVLQYEPLTSLAVRIAKTFSSLQCLFLGCFFLICKENGDTLRFISHMLRHRSCGHHRESACSNIITSHSCS